MTNAAIQLEQVQHQCHSRQEIEKEFTISAKTSIFRAKPSLPLRMLIDRNIFENKGSVLNFGKGRYAIDGEAILNEGNADACIEYDYTYAPVDITNMSFGVTVAIYVLNTLPPFARHEAWLQLKNSLRSDGECYIAVRSDKEKLPNGVAEYDGVRTVKGTFQSFFGDQKFRNEALNYFNHVEILRYDSSMLLARCTF